MVNMSSRSVVTSCASETHAGSGIDTDNWHSQAQALLTQGRHREAEVIFRQILAFNAHDAVAWCNLGIVLEARAQWREAETAYRQSRLFFFYSTYTACVGHTCRQVSQRVHFAMSTECGA